MLVEDYGDSEANQTQTTTDYLYDGLKLISETITRQVGEESPGVWQVFYFYDASGRPWAAVDRKLSIVNATTHSFYLITDDRGDVLELLEADHIAFGSYRYDVYGRLSTGRSGPSLYEGVPELTWLSVQTLSMTEPVGYTNTRKGSSCSPSVITPRDS